MNEMDRGMRSVAYMLNQERARAGMMGRMEQRKVLTRIVAAWLPRKGAGRYLRHPSVKEEKQQLYSYSQIVDLVLNFGGVCVPHN